MFQGAALAAVLLLAAGCGPEPVHVRSIALAAGALSPALREAGLDEHAIDAAVREALTASRFRLGAGSRPHDAHVSVPSVRLVHARDDRGPRAEITVEIALAAEDPRAVARREADTASLALSGAATPREVWLAALSQAARGASEALAISFAAEDKPDRALIADLAGPDRRVRDHAIRVLGERKTRSAVPALVARLPDEEPRLAHRIAATLAQIGDERAVPTLIDLSLTWDPSLAGRLVRYIGDIGGAEAEGYLLTVESGHPDRRIRMAAREALDEMSARAKDPVAARR